MIRLLTVKSSNPKWLDQAADEYSEKINFFHKFSLVQLNSVKKGRDEAEFKKSSESEVILKSLKPKEYVILFDEKGKKLGSVEMSQKISKLQTHGTSDIVFVVGGAYGVDESVRKQAQEVWSLSDMVMNHHVAMLVVLEQIYRAFTILKNKPYHNI